MVARNVKGLCGYLFLCIILSACSRVKSSHREQQIQSNPPQKEQAIGQRLLLSINNYEFRATFKENATVEAFKELLPLAIQMEDLHDNEKYYFLEESLPQEEQKVTQIFTGDVMLYGEDCLVLFYQDFRTSYAYSPIARIENTKDLAKVLGDESVTIHFSME
jgi:hypothetical protein